MGRGKKKGDKKKGDVEEVTESVSSITVSPSEPSTSRDVLSPQPEEEESSGLTGSKKQKPKKPASKDDADTNPEKENIVKEVQQTVPAPIQKASIVEQEDEDGGLGLGGGGGRKKRPRRKKIDKSSEPTEISSSQSTVPLAAPVPPAGYPQQTGHQQEQKSVSSQPQISAWHAPPSHPSTKSTPAVSGGHPPTKSTPAVSGGHPQQQYPQPAHQQFPQQPYPQLAQQQYLQQPYTHQAYQQQPYRQPGHPQHPYPQPQYPQAAHPGPAYLPSGPSARQPSAQQTMPQGTPMKQPTTQPPRVTQMQHEKEAEQKVICKYQIPKKIIGNRVAATLIKVLTNYLPLHFRPIKIHRYDVIFEPDRPKKALPIAFQQFIKRHFPNCLPAFDQRKNFYSVDALPNITEYDRFEDTIEVKDDNGKIMKIKISIKGTGVVDLNTILQYIKSGTSLSPPTEAIQCVDVILRQGTLQSYVKSGRTFFRRPANPILLGDGFEIWTGLFQSALFTSRPYVNIDVAHKGFPISQPMIEALKSFKLDPRANLQSQQRYSVENFKLFLKGLRVVARIGGGNAQTSQKREFICNEIVEPSDRMKFNMTDSNGATRMVTVAEYFSREKNYRLQYPSLNCLWVGPRDKNIYYPMELLDVAHGQVCNRQLNDQQLSTMVREAATPPHIRMQKIKEVIQSMNYSRNIYFKKFGLEISEQFAQVPAKVLNPPRLEYGNGYIAEPRNGQWNYKRLLNCANLQLWGIIAIDIDTRSANIEQIIKLFKDCGNEMGMKIAEPNLVQCNVDGRKLESIMKTGLQKGLQLLVVVVPTRGRDTYSNVKKMAERHVGLLTQCLKEQTAARRMNIQTARNILLKVNSKLMGVNQALEITTLPNCLKGGGVMVVGADVTHPSPDQSNIPSIAAVTASIDVKCFQYNIGLSIQTPKKEMIVEFEDIMIEHLKVYREKQRALPKKIYVYRDGVSEGQFAEIMNSELLAIYNAYSRLSGNNMKPEVLFMLVQKRHHTRLFGSSSAGIQNVMPGTVVDTDIVHAHELDFYLVSHAAIKGTARPTRYHAVCNDGKLPNDEVEQLTYYLCHLYSRCARSVSYPTPTYYAHLACLRARVLTLGETFDNTALEKQPKRLRVLDKMLQTSRMFFV